MEVLIDGVAYVPAKDVESLTRWHAEALARVRQLEGEMERVVKLFAKARHDLAKSQEGQRD